MPDDVKIKITSEADIAGLNKAADALGKVETASTSASVAMGTFVGGFAQGLLQQGRAELEQLGRTAVDLADRLDDLSGKAGVSATALQTIYNAASKDGGSLEGVAQSLTVLQRAAANARDPGSKLAEAFGRLGVSAEDLRSLRPEELFYKLADAMQATTDRGRTMADIVAVMGRGAGELFATMSKGSAEIERAGKAMGVFGDVTVRELAGAKDQLAGLNNEMVVFAGKSLAALKIVGDKSGGGFAGWTKLALEAVGKQSLVDFSLKLAEAFKEAGGVIEQTGGAAAGAVPDLEALAAAAEDAAKGELELFNAARKNLELAEKNAEAQRKAAEWMRQKNPQLEAMDALVARIQDMTALAEAKAAGDEVEIARLQRKMDIEEHIKSLRAAGMASGEAARELAEKLVDANNRAKTAEEQRAEAAKAAADAVEREAAAKQKMQAAGARDMVNRAEEQLAAAKAGTSKTAIRKAERFLDETKHYEKLIGEGVDHKEALARAKSFAANNAKKALRDEGVIGGPGEEPTGADITKGGQFDAFGNRLPSAVATVPVAPPAEAAPRAGDAAGKVAAGAEKVGASGDKLNTSAGQLNAGAARLQAAGAALEGAAAALLGAANNFEARIRTLENRSGS